MERWRNKIAVVTGASSGIGAACCKYLVDNGMIVVGLARRKKRVEELRTQVKSENRERLQAIKCDVSDEEQVRQAFAEIESKHGPVAVLVNNAGISLETELVKADNGEALRAVIDTNVLGVAYCTREAFQSMKRHGIDGHVVIINSISGHSVHWFEDFGSMNIYEPSKHGVTAMTEVYRNEFRMHQTKIKVTSISPGVVDTEMLPDQARKKFKARLHADDVADAVLYCIQTPPHVQIHELTIKPLGELH